MSPARVKNEHDVCSLQKSLCEMKGKWILVQHDGGIYLAEQEKGCAATATIQFTRREFVKLVEWYLREQPETPEPQE